MNKGINKFLGFMKLNDNEYEDIDEYEEDVELEEEERIPKKKPMVNRSTSRTKKVAAGSENDLDDYSDISLEEEVPRTRRTQSSYSSSRKSSRKNSNIVSMPGSGAASRAMEVCVSKPSEFNSCQEIGDILLSDRAVIINFDVVSSGETQRIIDFISGVCYAIGGDVKPISDKIIVVTPKNVDITGDYQMVTDSKVDVPNFSFEE